METELKFALPPDARLRIEDHAARHAAPGEASSTHVDHTTYFDTRDLALRGAGFSLRVRHRQGSNSFVQTVKAGANGHFQRREWEWPVASASLDAEKLSEVSGLGDALKGGVASLVPVFRTEVERTQRMLAPDPATRIEMALDDGVVIAGNKREPLNELELELKEGAEAALFRLGLDFLLAAPLSLLVESKAERGYHLHDGSRPVAHKAAPVALDPGMTVRAAFRRLMSAVLQHLLANQPAAVHGDEQEGVHQMRVGVRRLRSLLALFERFLEPHVRERFDEELQRLGQVLGVARDWDVFLVDTVPQAIQAGADLEWIEPLRARALEKQRAAHQAAKKAVQEPAFTRFVLTLEAWSRSDEALLPQRRKDLTMKDVAPDMLDRLAGKVGKRLAQSDADDPASLHSLRKSAKKLRYGIQYLEALYGEDAESYLARCDKLQKRLGELNDLDTMTRLARELTQDGRLDLAPALGPLASLAEEMTARELGGLKKIFGKFEREKPFWT
jgi:inorganic triphosphatase YgiF